MQEEYSLTQRWAEQDLKSARKTVWEILPLLRLEASQSEDGGRDTHPVLRIMDTKADNQGEHGSHFIRRFHVLDNHVERERTTATTTTRSAARNSIQLFGFRPSLGQQEGGRGSTALPAAARGGAGENTDNQAVGREHGARGVEPAPLRARGFNDGLPEGIGLLMPFERRYRGEGFLERRGPELGSTSHGAATTKTDKAPRQSPDENRPTPLAQQVLRLEDSGAAGDGAGSSSESVVAVVRAVLEPPSTKKCDCDGALHPADKGNQGGGDFGLRRNLGLCEVRGVVRVEAYLPSSSTTLNLRVKVPAAATASALGIEGSAAAEAHGSGTADDDSVLPLRVTVSTITRGEDSAAAPAKADMGGTADAGGGRCCEKQFHTLADAGHEEECRSRKRQRRVLLEARATEARRGTAEMLAAVQRATGGISHGSLLGRKNAGAISQQRQSLCSDKRASDSQPKQNNAFSMLLIRANVIAPMKRLSLTSGSWREAIGELVGCPPGQELRAVRGTSALASRRADSGHGKRRFGLDENGALVLAFFS